MKDRITQKLIYDLSFQFRNAMELAYTHNEFNTIPELRRFPTGSCGITSCLLGEYLIEHGISTTYINRTYYYGSTSFDSQSHTWLEIDRKLIIDITGDQFKNNSLLMNYSTSVYVGEYNEFYNLFECTPNGNHKLTEGNFLSKAEKTLYNKIKKYL